MLSAKKFADLALSMADTDTVPHFDKQAFRKHTKIFATLHPVTLVAMVKLTPEQQSVYLQLPGEIFYPASGAWGKAGCTHCNLKMINTKLAKEVLRLAWGNIHLKKK